MSDDSSILTPEQAAALPPFEFDMRGESRTHDVSTLVRSFVYLDNVRQMKAVAADPKTGRVLLWLGLRRNKDETRLAYKLELGTVRVDMQPKEEKTE